MSIHQYNAIFSIRIPDKCYLYSNRDLIDVFQIFKNSWFYFLNEWPRSRADVTVLSIFQKTVTLDHNLAPFT